MSKNKRFRHMRFHEVPGTAGIYNISIVPRLRLLTSWARRAYLPGKSKSIPMIDDDEKVHMACQPGESSSLLISYDGL
jgi:hypothetical protein